MFYKIFPFNNRYDNIVDHSLAADLTLEEYVEVLTHHIQTKIKDSNAFIAGDFKLPGVAEPAIKRIKDIEVPLPGTVRRSKENVTLVNSICVDFDDGVTIEEARTNFKHLFHIGYTSFNHRLKGHDRFRMVFPLENGINPTEVAIRTKSLREYFKGCDKSTFDIGRLFYLPSYDPANGVEPFSWVNYDGDFFDPFIEEISPEEPISVTITRPVGVKSGNGRVLYGTLNLYDLFQSKGLINKHLGNGKYSVICPNYLSHSGRDKSGTVIWSGIPGKRDGFMCQHSHCRGMHVTDMFTQAEIDEHCEREDTSLFLKAKEKVPDYSETDEHKKDVLIMPRESAKPEQREFAKISNAGDREWAIKQFVRNVNKKDSASCHFVIRTPEGFGKSTLLVSEQRKMLNKVMFLSSSNKQANEKFETFAKKYSAQRVWSFGAKLENDYQVSAIYDKVNDDLAWGETVLNEEETVKAIQNKLQCSEERAAEIFVEVYNQAKNSKELTADVVVSTFSTGYSLFKKLNGKTGYTIILDDPSTSDLITHKAVFNSENQLVVGEERDVEDVSFGMEFARQDRIIWTTTEKMVVELIKHQHDRVQVTDIAENLDTDNHVFIMESDLVRKRFKGLLNPIHDVVEERAFQDLSFIANGIGSDDNLVNTKGRNDLSCSGIVVSSCPHPLEGASLSRSLGFEITDGRFIEPIMVTDVIDQAIGRAQGYRAKHNNFTLLLCDAKFKVCLQYNSRYSLTPIDAYIKKQKGYKLENIEKIPSWMAIYFQHIRTWQSFITVMQSYVYNTASGKKIDLSEESRLAVFQAINDYKKKPEDFIEKLSHGFKDDEPTLDFDKYVASAIKVYEKQHKADVSAKRAEVAKSKEGKRIYIHPSLPAKMFIPGEEEPGYKLKSKRKPNRK